MKTIGFQTRNLADLTPAELTNIMRKPNPLYLAMVGGNAVLVSADCDIDEGSNYTTDDESSLPAQRLAIRSVAVFVSTDIDKPACPVLIGNRNIGGMEQDTAFRLIGAVAAKLLENANATDRGLFQRKIDSAQDTHTTVSCYVRNGGGNYKVQDASIFAGFNEVVAIDVAMGNDSEKHQMVLGGMDANNKPAIATYSPYTGQELSASSTSVRIQIPIEVTDIESVAVDRDTRTVTFIAKIDGRNKAYANKLGTAKIQAISEFDGAETVRFKKSGLYAFKADGSVLFSKRNTDGKLDLAKTQIVLSGIDVSEQRLHDVKIGDDGSKIAILTARATKDRGSRQWTTQSLQGTQAA